MGTLDRIATEARRTISGFIEAMLRVAMRCEDGDFMTTVLKAYSSIDDEPLGATNA